MAVAPVPTLQLPPSSELQIGSDRGAQLPDPRDATVANPTATGAGGFEDVLADTVRFASHAGNVAETKALAFARGQVDDLHGTMIAVKKAEISLKLVGSIRNKLLDAFHEVWRISV